MRMSNAPLTGIAMPTAQESTHTALHRSHILPPLGAAQSAVTRSGCQKLPRCCNRAEALHLGRPLTKVAHCLRPARVMGHCIAVAAAAVETHAQDLLIVGPGVLGSYLGHLWLEQHPDARVVGQTNTEKNHDRLRSLGLQPRTKAEAGDARFPHVVFAAPPSGSPDYVAEVRAALAAWDRCGTFVFTSSGGVYAHEDGRHVSEGSEASPFGKDDRTDRLLRCEQAVLEAGGCLVRLAGLYHAQRGAHTFFLRAGKVQRWAGYTLNLIHYQDAARLVAVVLRGDGSDAPYRGRVFLGCDGTPLTFQEMMDATLASGRYEGRVEFLGSEDSAKLGKRLDNSATRAQLGWAPEWASYQAFMAAGAQDWYTDHA